MFYATMYTSKTTQKEDSISIIRVSNALSKHITRKLATENKEENEGKKDQDFVLGLSRMLCAIQAHVSTNIVSAPLAHYIALHNSNRFSFSHEFSYLLISQIIDHFKDGPKTYRLKKTNSPNVNESHWADMCVNDIIFRPIELKNICAYEQTMWYEQRKITSKTNDFFRGTSRPLIC